MIPSEYGSVRRLEVRYLWFGERLGVVRCAMGRLEWLYYGLAQDWRWSGNVAAESEEGGAMLPTLSDGFSHPLHRLTLIESDRRAPRSVYNFGASTRHTMGSSSARSLSQAIGAH